MHLISLAEACRYEIGEKLPAFDGKISRIHDFHDGENDKGWWSIQNLELTDEQDRKVKLKLKVFNNRDAIDNSWLNKMVRIESGEGERGPKGLKMAPDGYSKQQGAKIVELRIDDGAQIYLLDHAERPESQNRQASSRQPPATGRSGPPPPNRTDREPDAPQSQPERTTPPAKKPFPLQRPPKTPEEIAADKAAQSYEAVKGAIGFVARKLNGYRVIMRALDKLQEERTAKGKPISAEQLHGMCSTLFIAGDRLAQWDGLPAMPEDLEKFWPEPKKSATNRAQ